MTPDHGLDLVEVVLDLVELDVAHRFEATPTISLLKGRITIELVYQSYNNALT